MKNISIFICLLTVVSCGTLFKQYYPLADEIISHMTLDQKIGQTLQTDFSQLNQRGDTTQYSEISEYNLGSVLVGGNGCPDGLGNLKVQDDYSTATMANWQDVAKKVQANAPKIDSPSGTITINLLLGTDAVHGNQHVLGTILFPHNIGLAASHNPQNFANAATWNSKGVKTSGFNFAFAPTVAVSHNPQWGRFYETMGVNPTEIKQFAKAYVKALQDDDGVYLRGVLASTKHFLGDGATFNGNDEGNTKVYNMTNFLEVNMAGYLGALESNTGNIMVSYSAINDIAMSINSNLLQGTLKDENDFDGFLISDYDAIGKASSQGKPTTGVKMELSQAYLMSFNAGMDMVMQFPRDDNEINRYYQTVKGLLASGELREERINDAVRRILAVKLAMKLVDVPKSMAEKYNYNSQVPEQVPQAGTDEYTDALTAAQESLVLLKNDASTLPLKIDNIKYIVLVGERGQLVDNVWTNLLTYDNIGAQNGGWSVRWQGFEGNKYWSGDLKTQSKASSILDDLTARINGKQVQIIRAQYTDPTSWSSISAQRTTFLNSITNDYPFTAANTVIIGAIAESPYAEFMGDVNNIYCRGVTTQVEGCAYNSHINDYMPLQQPTDLTLNYDAFSVQTIKQVKSKDAKIPLVTVLFSGRPMLVDDAFAMSSAFVAAWLPGTTGGAAVGSALFGDYKFRNHDQVNTLPVPWPKSAASLKDFPIYKGANQPKITDFLYDVGYGLSTATQITE